MNLFRRSFALDRYERPTADEWNKGLLSVIEKIESCPICRESFVVDLSKKSCPICKKAFPHLKIRILNTNRIISLDQGAVQVGRSDCGGSRHVSSVHAVFKIIGPQVWVQPVGSNPTFQKKGRKWITLPNGELRYVKSGDAFRFGDVEAQIE
ncbi:hypothetical protein BVX94_02045 [bacterium B17]|nr:hypothetical protein BVX94_02045 [bacterium B17]